MLKIQIVISILTLVLTPFFSGLVVYLQLDKQHDIWNVQRKIILEEKLLQERIDRIDDTGRIITSLIRKSEMVRVFINGSIKAKTFPDDYDKKLLDKFMPTGLKIAKEYEDLEAEFLNIVLINELYFGSAVKKKGNEVVSHLYLLKPPLMLEEKMRLFKAEYAKQKDGALDKDLAITNILKRLDNPEEKAIFSNKAKELLAEMHKELKAQE